MLGPFAEHPLSCFTTLRRSSAKPIGTPPSVRYNRLTSRTCYCCWFVRGACVTNIEAVRTTVLLFILLCVVFLAIGSPKTQHNSHTRRARNKKQGDGLPIGVMRCSDAAGEALAVATQLELYWSSGRVAPSEMAVMYRTNAQSRSFEEACLRKALPFVVVGAQRFYERREVILFL